VAPVATDSGLAGLWNAGHGTFIQFQANGSGSYTGTVVRDAGYTCTPLNDQVSGTGNTYSGTVAYYKGPLPSCGPFVGNGTQTLTLSADGSTVDVGGSAPPGMTCSNCDVRTWTRVQDTSTASTPDTGSSSSSAGASPTP
jgi:hypothetical protein